MSRALLTHEMGSLAKPGWRVKAYAGKPLSEQDIEDARSWGERIGVPEYDRLLDLLERTPLGSKEDRHQVAEWSSRYGVRFLESAGLDVVYDGEQQRSEMYQWAVAHANGFEFKGTVRSWDNKYYSKAAVVGPISLETPYHNEEFEFLRRVAGAQLKIPITGAYTLADWSFDEHHFTETDLRVPVAERKARRKEARRAFTIDLAKNLIRPNLAALVEAGGEWIQGFFSTHLCFSDYNLFFPAIEAMTECRQFAVGFANYDTRELGRTEDERPGYVIIKKFRDLPYQPALGLGVLDIHADFIESPELVRDRILFAVDVFGDPERIHVTPDCGLRTRSWDVAYAKLRNMVEGVALAKKDLGL
jgi:5-methyltetrahydropteroyltriglutamate--homocysteine methyltransferase